ncbi:hypothetical protein DSO57_1036125 [Entomophthora muscae]|uniref:Uncharacterized protein n=1 Tax=Entomophthora muscae TaxID=34485 RepID=A0ACC2RQ84_9FUNG|nr:hypothetical protein DSO57_1036125 [Entomophthora muscae]
MSPLFNWFSQSLGMSPVEAGAALSADAAPPFALIFFLPSVSSRIMHMAKD